MTNHTRVWLVIHHLLFTRFPGGAAGRVKALWCDQQAVRKPGPLGLGLGLG